MIQVAAPLRQCGLHHGNLGAALTAEFLCLQHTADALPGHDAHDRHDGQRHHDFNQGKALLCALHGGPNTLLKVSKFSPASFFAVASSRSICGFSVELVTSATL